MDINLKRRAKEKNIAAEVAEQFIRETPTTEVSQNDLLAHHFGVVCQRLEFVPDEASTGRVLSYVLKALVARSRQIDKARDAVDGFADAVKRAAA
jgi:hypothetical protein